MRLPAAATGHVWDHAHRRHGRRGRPRVTSRPRGHGSRHTTWCRRAGGPAWTSRPARASRTALLGADAVVHCADDTSRGDTVTVYGTRRLADAAAAHGVHLVHISIVGIDEHPMGYYRRKLRAEQGIDGCRRAGHRPASHPVPFPRSILRPNAERRPVHRHDRRHGLPAGRHRLRRPSASSTSRLGPRPAAYVRATDVAGPDVLHGRRGGDAGARPPRRLGAPCRPGPAARPPHAGLLREPQRPGRRHGGPGRPARSRTGWPPSPARLTGR